MPLNLDYKNRTALEWKMLIELPGGVRQMCGRKKF